jgi:pyruvate/2-oxoglutarate dehydrogenase complex dihydrolipoamide acyltransferase (E2) component
MAQQELVVPQMGEGLQEVIIETFHKKPGDRIERDEVIYSMETDKAVMEVESPFAGVLTEWLAAEGDVLPIGAPIARLEVEGTGNREQGTETMQGDASIAPTPHSPFSTPSLVIPPRTRAYAKQHGLSDEELQKIGAISGKLMPADIDTYLARRSASLPPEPEPADDADWIEKPLGQQQRVFMYRLKRSAQVVIPATAKRQIAWTPIREAAEAIKARGGVQPSSFQTFAYAVMQAVRQHPRFRSALIGETTIREYKHVNVGIAVGLPDGQLTIAQVNKADALSFEEFVSAAQTQIRKAREGEDQADETTQLLLTYMGPYEIIDAVPVLVAPAVAVLFIGSVFMQEGQPVVTLALTFDHRLIQGIEAANFLKTIAENAANIGALL